MGPSDFGEKSIKNCVQERDGDAWTPGCVTEGGLDYCNYDGIRRTLALKAINPNLKVMFSVGGWTAGGWIFSEMAQTRERRAMFIQSAIHFMDYFGMDGIDLDWEFPAFDMLPEVPTDPEDKQHFTSLMKEMRTAFDKHDPPYLITFAAAADPFKAGNAYELDLVHPHVDWFNVMSYDYHGAWDNFTGIDQPIYGKWEEGFIGHPMYQFNIYDTIMYYINEGVPPEKLSLGIHTEGKAWILAENATEENCPGEDCPAGIYCPAISGAPNMTYSRQVGWMFYYEVLQFYFNDTMPDAELPTHWPDLKPGLEHWTIYDNEHGNEDGCYLAPFAYQGRYWISYDDEVSVDMKVRFSNHYGLKGAFVWEVDTDNFRGLFDKKKYTILSQVVESMEGGKGLEGDEILGHGHENKGKCAPEAPMCNRDWITATPGTLPTVMPTTPECTDDSQCIGSDELCNADYSNCNYCDGGNCVPGWSKVYERALY
jgi:chitinase